MPKPEKINFSQNSNLKVIESYAFSETKINSIFIPSKVSKISEYAFKDCKNLQIVEVSVRKEWDSVLLPPFSRCPNIIIMIPFSQ